MSVVSSINISFIRNDVYDFTIIDLINAMLINNWKMVRNEKICYLPLGDDDLFDWNEKRILESELCDIVKQKEVSKEIVGIVFYWENTDIGLSMLIFQDYQISFSININRVKIDFSNVIDITDVSWYLEKIIPCFNSKKFKIQNLNFSEDR